MGETLLQLSPSSAADFKSCPRLFKYRSIEQLPEPVSEASARGSLVHLALERLFGEPAVMRTAGRAGEILDELWAETGEDRSRLPEDSDPSRQERWLTEARKLLANLFKLEDPSELYVRRLEWWVEYEVADLHLRGIIDRLEERPDGSWILSDYKTGRVPGEYRELQAFFGLHFYALVCWRSFGVIPAEIRLVYLADPAVLTLHPHERKLIAFERQMKALGHAIKRAMERDDWRPRPSPFCMSCAFQDRCPAWSDVV
jgi:putative RecB family exonuclease